MSAFDDIFQSDVANYLKNLSKNCRRLGTHFVDWLEETLCRIGVYLSGTLQSELAASWGRPSPAYALLIAIHGSPH